MDLQTEPELNPALPLPASPPQPVGGKIIRAALIISLGNILTRIFGVAREVVLAALFGTTGVATAFAIADNVLNTFFDLLVSGAISSALVPVLSRYAAEQDPEKRAEFWQIVNILLTLGILFFVGVVAILQVISDPLTAFMTEGQTAEVQQLAAGLTRVVIFGIIFLGVSAIMMAALQALQRFTWSALSLVARNASVVVFALLFQNWGIWSMVIGVVAGTALIALVQGFGLRDLPLRPSLNWRHPAIREILKLYAPIFGGLLVTTLVIFIDRSLASQTGEASIGAMRYATTLQQFTLGLVGSAISIAILPTLSQQAALSDLTKYRQTLFSGLKLLMVLIIPATLGLLAIALPTVRLIYERGKFEAADTNLTYVALLGYLPGIPAAAIDQMLIFSFYARKNTLTPVIVGVVANLAFLALALISTYIFKWGMMGLVLANSAQQVIHMLIMFVLLRRLLGSLNSEGLWYTTLKTLLGSLLLMVTAFLAAGLVNSLLGTGGLLPNLLAVVAGIVAGGISYLVALRGLKVSEFDHIAGAIWRKIKK